MASSVTPYRTPLIVAQRRPFTPTSGGKTRVSWLQERRERCADVVNKLRPRPASRSGGERETPASMRFFFFPPGSPVQLKSKENGVMGICCLRLPNILAPLPLITPALLFLGKCPISQSPTGERRLLAPEGRIINQV